MGELELAVRMAAEISQMTAVHEEAADKFWQNFRDDTLPNEARVSAAEGFKRHSEIASASRNVGAMMVRLLAAFDEGDE